jgi:hypothetical protein
MQQVFKYSIAALLVMFFVHLCAQPPARFYTKFGGDGDEVGYSGKQTLDGQYVVVGSSTSYGSHGETDIYLLKVDTMGKLLWHKYIGGSNHDLGKAIVQLPDSGFVIAGHTSSFGSGGYDAFLVRTDKNGEPVWQRTFGGAGWDFASDLVFTHDSNIVVVGNTTSFGAGKKDGFVVWYSISGDFVRQKFFGGSEDDELRSIIKTNDSLFATVGYTESKGDIDGDWYFLKLNSVGDTLFTRVFGGQNIDFANDLVQNDNDEYNICGAGTFTVGAKTEGYIKTMSATGNTLQEMHEYRKIDQNEEFISAANSQHKSFLTGYVRSVVLPAVKQQGEIMVLYPLLFAHKINDFGLEEDEFVYSVEGTKDGGFLCVGSTSSFDSYGSDLYLIKYDTTMGFYQSILSLKNEVYKKPRILQFPGHVEVNYGDEFFELVRVTDIYGREVGLHQGKTNSRIIKTDGYATAIYVIEVHSEDGYFRQKIHIQN